MSLASSGDRKQVQRQAQDVLIVQAYQLLERALVTPLRRPNQFGFVHSHGRLGHSRLQHSDRRAINENVTPGPGFGGRP